MINSLLIVYLTATPTASYPPTKDRSSEILYGEEKAVGRGVYFMSNVRERMDIFFDKNTPSNRSRYCRIQRWLQRYSKKRRKDKAFTEITQDNLRYCKGLIELVQ